MTETLASWQCTDGVAVLMLDNPPVNAISAAVRSALADGVSKANRDAGVIALIVACAGKTFFAGADITEFGRAPVPPLLPEVVDLIEASEKPVIAAIHGTALGGGLEIAMACHYRVAAPSARLGLPEVKLALMSGARGTQLLPRLIGVERALEIAANGEQVSATDALAMGLVDELADGDLIDSATACACQVAGKPPRRTSKLVAQPVAGATYDTFLAKNSRKFRGLDAPPAIVAAIRNATELPFAEGARLEREAFLKLREGPQSEAMRHAFFAEREASKVPGLEGVEPRQIASVAVIGAGTMGSGIAIALLSAGLPVALYERDSAALERGVSKIRSTIAGNAQSGRMKPEQAETALSGLTAVTSMSALSAADLVIEAAFETMEVKQAIFAELDGLAKRGAILATNTSYLDVDMIAAATRRPRDVLGLHFFSPANVMKLIEIVRGKETAADVLAGALALAKRIGKVAVVSANAHGFIGNRMLAVRRREADAMLVEGASPQQIDRVLEDFGFPMGPFRVSDLSGLDIGWSLENSTGSTIRERLCEAGRLGQKSDAGYYDYVAKRNPAPSAVVDDIVGGFARGKGIARRNFESAEVLDRLIWPMIDEGARLLSEGIAVRASDIDTVWLNGYGWPRWTGGPMFHLKKTGVDKVCRRLEELGHRPSKAMRQLAASGRCL